MGTRAAEEMSSIIGQESRAVGITSAMSPVIDVPEIRDGDVHMRLMGRISI